MLRGALAVSSAAVLALVAVSASQAHSAPRPLMRTTGLGAVRFGTPKAEAVSALTALLGTPSARFINSGCGARYTETAWGHLYVEFRAGKLTGYRYIESGWSSGRSVRPSKLPLLSTSRGVALGSTLARLRRAYGRLDLVGSDRWMVRGGLIFYDDAKRDPPPPSSRIVEIKIGTCGDF